MKELRKMRRVYLIYNLNLIYTFGLYSDQKTKIRQASQKLQSL